MAKVSKNGVYLDIEMEDIVQIRAHLGEYNIQQLQAFSTEIKKYIKPEMAQALIRDYQNEGSRLVAELKQLSLAIESQIEKVNLQTKADIASTSSEADNVIPALNQLTTEVVQLHEEIIALYKKVEKGGLNIKELKEVKKAIREKGKLFIEKMNEFLEGYHSHHENPYLHVYSKFLIDFKQRKETLEKVMAGLEIEFEFEEINLSPDKLKYKLAELFSDIDKKAKAIKIKDFDKNVDFNEESVFKFNNNEHQVYDKVQSLEFVCDKYLHLIKVTNFNLHNEYTDKIDQQRIQVEQYKTNSQKVIRNYAPIHRKDSKEEEKIQNEKENLKHMPLTADFEKEEKDRFEKKYNKWCQSAIDIVQNIQLSAIHATLKGFGKALFPDKKKGKVNGAKALANVLKKLAGLPNPLSMPLSLAARVITKVDKFCSGKKSLTQTGSSTMNQVAKDWEEAMISSKLESGTIFDELLKSAKEHVKDLDQFQFSKIVDSIDDFPKPDEIKKGFILACMDAAMASLPTINVDFKHLGGGLYGLTEIKFDTKLINNTQLKDGLASIYSMDKKLKNVKEVKLKITYTSDSGNIVLTKPIGSTEYDSNGIDKGSLANLLRPANKLTVNSL